MSFLGELEGPVDRFSASTMADGYEGLMRRVVGVEPGAERRRKVSRPLRRPLPVAPALRPRRVAPVLMGSELGERSAAEPA